MPMLTGNRENPQFYGQWTVQDSQNELFAKILQRQRVWSAWIPGLLTLKIQRCLCQKGVGLWLHSRLLDELEHLCMHYGLSSGQYLRMLLDNYSCIHVTKKCNRLHCWGWYGPRSKPVWWVMCLTTAAMHRILSNTGNSIQLCVDKSVLGTSIAT